MDMCLPGFEIWLQVWRRIPSVGLLAVSFVLFVIGFLGLAEGGTEQPRCGLAEIGCLIASHEDLAAGLIGVAGALLAAWLAYMAVQGQIAEERIARERQKAEEAEDRRRQQAEAKEAAVLCITPAIHAAAVALAAIEVAVNINAVNDEPADQAIAAEATHIQSGIEFFAVRESIWNLNINDKLIYLAILGTLSAFVEITVHPSPAATRRGRLHAQRRGLMNLSTYLRGFDTQLADVYGRDSGTVTAAATPKK